MCVILCHVHVFTAGYISAQHVVARYTECGYGCLHVNLPVTNITAQHLN